MKRNAKTLGVSAFWLGTACAMLLLYLLCTLAISVVSFFGVHTQPAQQVELLLYACVPACMVFALCLGALFGYAAHFLASDVVRVSRFLQDVSKNTYPPLMEKGEPAEMAELVQSANRLSAEIQQSLTNYKDAIDAFIHEIKTPLTSIIGYSELLLHSNSLPDTDRDNVDYIVNESQRLNALTRKIIYFLSVNQKNAEWMLLDPNRVVQSAILSTRSRARLKEISVRCKPLAQGYLYADEELLVTCVVNILENALKASDEQSEVVLEWETNANAVSELRIRDFGKGIPPSDLNKIFQPFYMLHKSKGPLENGLGLGLAICQSIATAHHCGITVSSEVGVGTCVSIHFPFEEYQQRHAASQHPERGAPLYIPPVHP